jgi:pimeloyl-ACP methyl ester carboxylesterase
MDSFKTLPKLSSELVSYCQNLYELTSVALASQITYHPILTPLQQQPIATAVAQSGKGNDAMILVHGFDSSLLEYRRLFPPLSSRFQVLALDLLGFGFTERPKDLKINTTAIKTHLFHTWKTLIGKPVIWIGASMGGAAVLDFALTYPEAVSKLVLIDSAGLQPGPPGHLLIPPLGWLATEFLRSPWVRQQISRNAYHDPGFATADAQACAASHLQVPGWRQALIQFTKSGGYPSLKSQLSQLDTPTLILWGKSDKILGTADADNLQLAIRNSTLKWIQEAGHVPHLEKPEIVAKLIDEWLTA